MTRWRGGGSGIHRPGALPRAFQQESTWILHANKLKRRSHALILENAPSLPGCPDSLKNGLRANLNIAFGWERRHRRPRTEVKGFHKYCFLNNTLKKYTISGGEELLNYRIPRSILLRLAVAHEAP